MLEFSCMELNSQLDKIFRISDGQKKALKNLGLLSVEDLLFYIPNRYENTNDFKAIKDLKKDGRSVIYAKVLDIKLSKGFRSKIPMAKAILEDTTGKISAVWFNQQYIAKMLNIGSYAKFTGKISENKNGLYISNPEYEIISAIPKASAGQNLFQADGFKESLYPVYKESRGITSKWIYHSILKIFQSGLLDQIEDPIPENILKKYNLPNIKTALIWIHNPQKTNHYLSAKKRFAFQEVFLIQIYLKMQKENYRNFSSFQINRSYKDLDKFISNFPFKPTNSQEKSIKDILKDFSNEYAMSRLLEGDVGSGKTAVAASTSYAVISSSLIDDKSANLQVAYMAPTEILAKQLYESFILYFKDFNINIGLLTSKECRKFPSKVNKDSWTKISKSQLLKWVAGGEISILIGTHSLIAKSVKFKNLAYTIIDEQHRFGTKQRMELTKKSGVLPHLLSMTATPIPRTLALTLYGDLDLTLLDQMPSGRKPIITELVEESERNDVYSKVRNELKNGRQVYVICPRINEPDETKKRALLVKSAIAEASRLQKSIFKEYKVGVVHSKMKPKEKEDVMLDFYDKKIDILVATSVVEVGVNVPNATVIIIEGAQTFGLSQLHQLRGRVIRGNHQAYCYVFSDSKSKKTRDRLKALKTAKNGFELAEKDLKLRGVGELFGKKQWGVSDIAMDAIRNLKMVEAARKEAENILQEDVELERNKILRFWVEKKKQKMHFE